MDRTVLRQIGWAAASLGLTTLLVGCGEMTAEETASDNASLAVTNGLAAVNGLSLTNGLAGVNGLATTNGLSLTNGLASVNGLATTNGLMTTAAGRKTVAYLARCALASNDTLVKADASGTNYTFAGSIGLCPAWKSGSIATDFRCQELISACMMAHVNSAGIHIPIWLDGDPTTTPIGWGMDTVNYPYQEGTFFGNILMTGNYNHANFLAPVGFYCDGDGFAQGSSGVVAGRLGDTSTDAYSNPWGAGTLCKNVCTGQYSQGAGVQKDPDGYINCATPNIPTFNNMITVWRNNNYTPQFDTGYMYSLSGSNTKNAQMVRALTSGTTVDQQASSTGDTQQFAIVASGSNWKIELKSATSKCLDAGSASNGTAVTVASCGSGTQQQWTVTPDVQTGSFFLKNVKGGTCMNVRSGSTSAGALIEVATCSTSTTSQKFVIKGQ
jgi:Ricin-type beta-trefoil lectin domain